MARPPPNTSPVPDAAPHGLVAVRRGHNVSDREIDVIDSEDFHFFQPDVETRAGIATPCRSSDPGSPINRNAVGTRSTRGRVFQCDSVRTNRGKSAHENARLKPQARYYAHRTV